MINDIPENKKTKKKNKKEKKARPDIKSIDS